MNSRLQKHTPLQHSRTGTLQRQTRQSIRFDRPSLDRLHWQGNGTKLQTTELTNFALTCIEQLAFPDPKHKQSVEQTIARVIMEKLPSYTKLQAKLNNNKHSQMVSQLRHQLESMQQTISSHLVQTGVEIGLPKPLIIKLADVTDDVLSRL